MVKRSIGHVHPEFFSDNLTNKDDEAIANPARFASLGKKKSNCSGINLKNIAKNRKASENRGDGTDQTAQ